MRSLCLLLLFPLGVQAGPPAVTVPAEVRGEPAAFVVVRAEVKDGKGAKFVPLDAGLNVFPGGLLADPNVTVVVAPKAGRYKLLVYSGNESGPSDPVFTTVVLGDGQGPIIAPPPVKPPDDTKPPEAGGKFYFVLARPDGPVDERTAACVRLPAWAELRKAGHEMKDYPAAELPKGVAKPSNLPSVVVLRVAADGKSSSLVREVPLPTTDAAVRELVK